jgi:hypothetical protein
MAHLQQVLQVIQQHLLHFYLLIILLLQAEAQAEPLMMAEAEEEQVDLELLLGLQEAAHLLNLHYLCILTFLIL